MTLKMILADGTEITLAEAGLTQHYVVVCSSRTAFQRIWGAMTEENLSVIRIKRDGQVVQVIRGSKLSGTQTVGNPDGTITGHFYLEGGEFDPPAENEEPAVESEAEEE